MQLALLLYKYFPYGGMQRDFRRFVEALQKRGHDCRIYCIDWQGESLPDTELRLVPARALTRHTRNQRFHAWVKQDITVSPVDGVVGFNKMPGLDVYYAADGCYADIAATQRSSLYRLTPRYKHFSSYEQAVFGQGSNTEILLISETEKVKFQHYYHTPESRLHMLPPGIDRDRCRSENAAARREAARAQLDIASGELVFLFVGSGFRKKGLDRAITALAALLARREDLTARLLIAGQDKERRFRQLAKQQGVADQVHFLGGRDDIPELLLAADALVHPALDEAAGIVLLEALVAGLPVIVTDVCGYAHHIATPGAGVVLDSPFEPAMLTTAMDRMSDGYFRHQCRERGLAYAERTDLWSMHATGAALIEGFLKKSAQVPHE